MEKICERLLEERERLNLNKGQMAAAGGIANSTYTNYEDGKRSPDGDFLAGIAAAGADVQYILTGIRAGGAIAHPTASYTVLTPREAALVDNYRHIADEEGKRYVERSAQMAVTADKDETQSRTKKAG